jgi:hypothetical protein
VVDRTRSQGTRQRIGLSAMVLALVLPAVSASAGHKPSPEPTVVQLVEGLEGGSGSTIGPRNEIYVTEGLAGRISRVDPRSGDVSTFTAGLPPVIPAVGVGGAMDVVFIGRIAYALVTLVGPDVGGNDVVGIYRIDGPDSFSLIADIGAFSLANPPGTDFFIPTGVHYAIETYRGRFLVTDGHHNRVLQVTLDGEITALRAFDNIVPTGLDVLGSKIYMTEAGPVPHLPEDGKLVSFKPGSTDVKQVASGASLLVDVEIGRRNTLYALSQGDFPPGNPEGSPAAPGTGSLVKANKDGSFTEIVDGLDQPTSLEIIEDTAYVVGLPGEIWKIRLPGGRHDD